MAYKVPESSVGNVAAGGFVPRSVDFSGLAQGLSVAAAAFDEKERKDGQIIAAETIARANERIAVGYLDATENARVAQDDTGVLRSMYGERNFVHHVDDMIQTIQSEELDMVTNRYARQTLMTNFPKVPPQYSLKSMQFESRQVTAERNRRIAASQARVAKLAINADGSDAEMYIDQVRDFGGNTNAVSVDMMNGWLQRNPALVMSHATDDSSPIYKELSADQILQYRAKAESRLQAQKGQLAQQSKRQFKNLLAITQDTGVDQSDELEELILGFDEQTQEDMRVEYDAAFEIGQARQSVKYKTFGEINELIKSLEPSIDSDTYIVDSEKYNTIAKIASDHVQSVLSDPFAHAESTIIDFDGFESEVDRVNAIVDEQRRIGVPPSHIRYTSNAELSALTTAFTDPELTPAKLEGAAMSIGAKYGEDQQVTSAVLNEISNQQGVTLPDGFRTVIRMKANNLPDTNDVALALINYKDNQKTIPSEIQTQIGKYVTTKTYPYSAKLNHVMGATDLVTDTVSAINALTYQYVASGMNASTAAEKSFDNVIGKYHHPIDSGTFIMPLVAVNPENPAETLPTSYGKVASELDRIKRGISEGWGPKYSPQHTFNMYDPRTNFILAKYQTTLDNAIWVTDGDGVRLMLPESGITVLNDQRQPMTYSFFELQNTAIEQDEEMRSNAIEMPMPQAGGAL